jgi:hypothetical protein
MLVQEKEAMSRRAGVLNLMLHSTFNHELALLMQQQQAALHAKKQNRFAFCLGQFTFLFFLMLKRALTKLP